MKVSIVACGTGNENMMTIAARECFCQADVIIGATRLLEDLSAYEAVKIKAINPDEIVLLIDEKKDKNIAVALSGDTGFYSGAKKLIEKLGDKVEVIPGISSVQYMASALKKTWQDVTLVSAHGTACNVIGHVLNSKKTFLLTGGELTVAVIIEKLVNSGLGGLKVYIGERLSYADELITKGLAKDFVGKDFDSLSVMWIEREDIFRDRRIKLFDEDFIRGKVPMTKEDVRTIACDFFQVRDNDVIFDIGAGTGSVAIQYALKYPKSRVVAVEINETAVELIYHNKEKFHAFNIEVCKGEATEVIEGAGTPNHVFIGGSKGNLKQILSIVHGKNPDVNLLITAVTMETIIEATSAMKELFDDGFTVTQIAVSKGRKLGNYNMLMAENPIFLIGRRGKCSE